MKKDDQSKFTLTVLSLLIICLGSSAFSLGRFANILLSIELVPSAYAEQKTTTTTTIRSRQAPTATRNGDLVREYIQSRTANSGPEQADSDQQNSGSPSAVQNAAELIKQQKARGN